MTNYEEIFDRELQTNIRLYQYASKEFPSSFTRLNNLNSFTKWILDYGEGWRLSDEFLIQECKKYPLFKKIYLRYILTRYYRYNELVLKELIPNTSHKDLTNIFNKAKLLDHLIKIKQFYNVDATDILKQLDQWIDINAFIKYNRNRPYILTLLFYINQDWIREEYLFKSITQYLVKSSLIEDIQCLLPDKYQERLKSLLLLKQLK